MSSSIVSYETGKSGEIPCINEYDSDLYLAIARVESAKSFGFRGVV